MFNRVEVKRNGLQAVKQYYMFGLLACVIYFAFSGELFRVSISAKQLVMAIQSGNILQFLSAYYNRSSLIDTTNIMAFFGVLGIIYQLIKSLLGFLWNIFVVHVLEVGLLRFFLKNREKETSISELSVPFQNNYKNIVIAQFYKNFYVFIGTICLIIPGIIFYFQYYFVPFLLADNPSLTPTEALAQSKKMTEGLKLDIFIFELSFIGWLILSAIIPYVGQFIIYPYLYAARSELYVCLKERRL